MDDGRSADGKKQIAGTSGSDGAPDRVLGEVFTEPNHVWPKLSTATRTTGWRFTGLLPPFNDLVFLKAFCAADVAVEFDDIAASGALVQTVHVLGNDGELRHATLPFHEREVAGIGMRSGDQFASPGIPFPDEFWVAPKRFGRGHLLRPESRPESCLRVPEGGHAAFGRDSRTGQNDNLPRAGYR